MIIKSIYRLFRRGGLVRSQRQFSTEVCGRGPSYYSSSVARQRDASLGVLLRIERMVTGKLADVESMVKGEISRRLGP
jgi:hypothetical protein